MRSRPVCAHDQRCSLSPVDMPYSQIEAPAGDEYPDDQSAHSCRRSKPKFEVKVDLDDRAFLFPSGKPVIQLVFARRGPFGSILMHPILSTRRARRRASSTLDLADARELGHKLVEVVHKAKSQLLVSEGTHITISVVAERLPAAVRRHEQTARTVSRHRLHLARLPGLAARGGLHRPGRVQLTAPSAPATLTNSPRRYPSYLSCRVPG